MRHKDKSSQFGTSQQLLEPPTVLSEQCQAAASETAYWATKRMKDVLATLAARSPKTALLVEMHGDELLKAIH